MSLEHSEVNENNLKKIVVNLGIFGVKHYTCKGAPATKKLVTFSVDFLEPISLLCGISR